MKTSIRMAFVGALALGFLSLATAGEEPKTVMVTGKVVCAKCTMKKADATECQNVLVTTDGDKTTEYYMVKNEVTEAFGHKCQGEKAAAVTGTLQSKDGKIWLAATKMEAPE